MAGFFILMKMKNHQSILLNLGTYDILGVLSAAAVLRKEKKLRIILSELAKIDFDSIKIYEALLQTYLFAGFPSALISLSIYSEYFNHNEDNYEQYEIENFKVRGEKNCREIYGNKFEKLIRNTKSFSPELADWLVLEGYGKVFGRKNLNLKEREACNIAVLSSLKFENQLYSHINGGHKLGLNWKEIENIIGTLKLLNNKKSMEFGFESFS